MAALIKPPTQITGEILFYLTCVLCIIIISPTLIYFTFRFNQYRNTIVVRKRYPNIVNITLILSILNICIRIPLTVLIVTPTHIQGIHFNQSDFLIFIESFLNVYISNAVVICIALRFWMIFYKINYTYSSNTSAWKTVINPLISTNNWFLKPSNKSSFGNAKHMFLRYFLPFYIVYSTIDFLLLSANRWSKKNILFEFHLSYFQFIDAFYYLFSMLFCVYLYKMTPNWDDHCFIRAEMKLGAMFWCISLIVYVLNSVIFLIFEIINISDSHSANTLTNEYIQTVITIYISILFFSIYGLILTAYPTNKIRIKPSDLNRASSPDQIEMILGRNKNHTNYENNDHSVTERSQPKNGSKTADERSILRDNHSPNGSECDNVHKQEIISTDGTQDLNTVLSDIISDGVMFDRFMQYLGRSFSRESLLFFVEIYQYKQFIILQFTNELILTENNKLFVTKLRTKMESKKSIKKLRNGMGTENNKSANGHIVNMEISNLFNVILPDSVPKSYLVYGDFMVKHIMNGKSVRKSMGVKLEKETSKFGIKLYEKEQEKQRKMLQQQQEQSKSKDSKSKSNKRATELSMSPSNSKITEHTHSDKSENRTHISPQSTNNNKIIELKRTEKRHSNKSKVQFRKESAYSQTEYTTFAGSYNSVRLQIPDSANYAIREDYEKESSNLRIHTSMESVTEKDIYDEIKVGTPSMQSQTEQTIPAGMGVHSEMDSVEIEESTATYMAGLNDPKHLTGGVSVEVDEHLDKNREISVTPQPSQTSAMASITNLGNNPSTTAIFVRNLSHTATVTKPPKYHKSKEYKEKFKGNTPITPFGSRQRFGSATGTHTNVSNLSVTMDEKDIQKINNIHSKDRISPNNSPKSLAPNPNTPSINSLKGIGFGDMPMNMNEAKNKIRVIAHKLYMKYVNIGAELEINIPHKTRKKLVKIGLNDLDTWLLQTQASMNELYNLFDDCMVEMFALMRSSITLFLDSKDYQQQT